MFTVCSKNQVRQRVRSRQATHLVGMLDPGDCLRFRPTLIKPENHLHLSFEDCESPDNPLAPTLDHCSKILEFGAGLPDNAVVVVHCFAGMCRSTAAALALHVQKHGDLDVARSWLAEDRPQALPNMLMAEHFDKLLDQNGKFVETCESINSHRMSVLRKILDW